MRFLTFALLLLAGCAFAAATAEKIDENFPFKLGKNAGTRSKTWHVVTRAKPGASALTLEKLEEDPESFQEKDCAEILALLFSEANSALSAIKPGNIGDGLESAADLLEKLQRIIARLKVGKFDVDLTNFTRELSIDVQEVDYDIRDGTLLTNPLSLLDGITSIRKSLAPRGKVGKGQNAEIKKELVDFYGTNIMYLTNRFKRLYKDELESLNVDKADMERRTTDTTDYLIEKIKNFEKNLLSIAEKVGPMKTPDEEPAVELVKIDEPLDFDQLESLIASGKESASTTLSNLYATAGRAAVEVREGALSEAELALRQKGLERLSTACNTARLRRKFASEGKRDFEEFREKLGGLVAMLRARINGPTPIPTEAAKDERGQESLDGKGVARALCWIGIAVGALACGWLGVRHCQRKRREPAETL